MASNWTITPDSALSKFSQALPTILDNAGYNEMYGIVLETPAISSHKTLIILQKFLRANQNDLDKAKTQLTEALKWRKDYKPLEAKDEIFDAEKFGGLGFVTKIKGVKATGNDEDVATFNIYGAAAKDPKKTFGDTDAFIRWRVALMELTLSLLPLNSSTQPIPSYNEGPDPYQAIQIHDYLSISFFRQPSEVRSSSTRIIDLFQKYYPETVSYKYFVNVPLVMQWGMGLMKSLLSSDSVQKMTWLTYGNQLAGYLGSGVPTEYGGDGPELRASASTTRFRDQGREETAKGESRRAVADIVKTQEGR